MNICLKDILNEDEIKQEYLNVQLLMFANKYEIDSLVQLCSDHLKTSLTMENVYGVIEAAYLIDDDDLLKKATKFVTKNRGTFKSNDSEWDAFTKSHPECFVKMMQFMMFDAQL